MDIFEYLRIKQAEKSLDAENHGLFGQSMAEAREILAANPPSQVIFDADAHGSIAVALQDGTRVFIIQRQSGELEESLSIPIGSKAVRMPPTMPTSSAIPFGRHQP